METIQAYLKRFVAWGIAFAVRVYRDIFRRTEVSIIGILFFLCLVYLIIIAVSTHYLHLEIATVVIQSVSEAITLGDFDPTTMGARTLSNIDEVQSTYLRIIGGTSIAATLIFGYIAARIALRPTRDALAAQKRFIGNIAHELRTPLATLQANSEVLAIERAKDPVVIELMESNVEELDRISDIINNLLSLNVLTRTDNLTFESVPLHAVVEHITPQLRQFAYTKKVTVVITKQGSVSVWGNKSALSQIVANLLKNAIGYTLKDGTVTVTTGTTNTSHGYIEVTDTGVGIPRAKLKRVFEPFYRIDSSRSRNTGGTSGLGLAIVSELVKLHHGKIAIKSIVQRGTTVRIELPVTDIETSTRSTTPHEVSVDFFKE